MTADRRTALMTQGPQTGSAVTATEPVTVDGRRMYARVLTYGRRSFRVWTALDAAPSAGTVELIDATPDQVAACEVTR